jgi:hypothetical protein
LILIACVLVFASAKVPENLDEKFECVADYLKKKGFLEDNFEYYVTNQELKCDETIVELSEALFNTTLINTLQNTTRSDSKTGFFTHLYNADPECYSKSFRDAGVLDTYMKIFINSLSTKLSENQKEQRKKKIKAELENKFIVTMVLCSPEEIVGILYENVIKIGEEVTLEDKQNDYCLRQYAVEKKLVDFKAIQLEINPYNIDTNINCADEVKDQIEVLHDKVKTYFYHPTPQPTRQLRCISRTIRNHKVADYFAKVHYLHAGTIADERKAQEKQNFIQFVSNLFKDLIKC